MKIKAFLKKLKSNFTFSYIEALLNKISKIEVNIFGELIMDTYQFCEAIEYISKRSIFSFKG